jgi:hypothetical protein
MHNPDSRLNLVAADNLGDVAAFRGAVVRRAGRHSVKVALGVLRRAADPAETQDSSGDLAPAKVDAYGARAYDLRACEPFSVLDDRGLRKITPARSQRIPDGGPKSTPRPSLLGPLGRPLPTEAGNPTMSHAGSGGRAKTGGSSDTK